MAECSGRRELPGRQGRPGGFRAARGLARGEAAAVMMTEMRGSHNAKAKRELAGNRDIRAAAGADLDEAISWLDAHPDEPVGAIDVPVGLRRRRARRALMENA